MAKFFLFLLVLVPVGLIGQSINGARLAGLASSGVALGDEWAVLSNQAGIISPHKYIGSILCIRQFADPQLQTACAAFVVSGKKEAFGISITGYGFFAYRELKAGACYARKFGQIAIALDVNFHQVNVLQYGRASAFSFETGLQYDVSSNFTLGAHLANPNRGGYSAAINSNVPATTEFGAAWRSASVTLSTSFYKSLDEAADLRLGIEYKPVAWLAFRTGVRANPFLQSAGFGIERQQLSVDLAVESHPLLGMKPQISVSYAF